MGMRFTAWVLQKFQAALEFDRKLDGVTGVTRLEWAKAVGSFRGHPAYVIKKEFKLGLALAKLNSVLFLNRGRFFKI